MTKKTLLTILTIGLIVSLSGVAATSAFADDEDFNSPLVQRLAETFGVSEDEVEAVFDAVKEEHHQEMEELRKDRLQKAVEDGVITEEQLNALQQKHQEMWDERKEEQKNHFEEMDAWFEEQGIDHDALMEYLGGSGPKGEFGMRGHGMMHHH